MEALSAPDARGNEAMMAAEELAEVAVLMASQPAHINVLEAIVLPVGQKYLGPRVTRASPIGRSRRAENGVNHRHVLDGVFNGNRHVATFTNGARKRVALNRILVAGGKLLSPGCRFPDVAPIVNEHPVGRLFGRIERNLHLDPPFCAEELQTLVRHNLRAAGEDGMAGGTRACAEVSRSMLHRRVALDQPDNALRLLLRRLCATLGWGSSRCPSSAPPPVFHRLRMFSGPH